MTSRSNGDTSTFDYHGDRTYQLMGQSIGILTALSTICAGTVSALPLSAAPAAAQDWFSPDATIQAAFQEIVSNAQSESSLGRILFVSEWEQKEEIHVMDPDGSNIQRLTTTKTGTGSWGAVWSPDRRTIAFGSDRDGNNEIYVMDADGSNIRRLTHTPDKEQSPFWSPDGKIGFVLQPTTGGGRGIYVMNADGSNVSRLAHYDSDFVVGPVWSPAGGKMAFWSGVQSLDGEFEVDIYVMDADGSNVHRLTQHAGYNQSASWSPDGKQIVFDSQRDGNYGIYVMDADGSNVRRLTQQREAVRPDWSSDGTKIAFHSTPDQTDHFEIYVMDADGSNVIRLTHGNTYAIHAMW